MTQDKNNDQVEPSKKDTAIEEPSTNQEIDTEDEEYKEILKRTRAMRFGQYKFVAFLALSCIVLMLLSPIFNRYLESYQVVVVDIDSGHVDVLTTHGMPITKRVSPNVASGFESGTFLQKDNFKWNPRKIELEDLLYDPDSSDHKLQARKILPDLYNRYTSEWRGTVVSVEYRRLPTVGGRRGEQEVEYLLTIDQEDGYKRELILPDSLWPPGLSSLTPARGAAELERIFEGRFLIKEPLSWEPILSPR